MVDPPPPLGYWLKAAGGVPEPFSATPLLHLKWDHGFIAFIYLICVLFLLFSFFRYLFYCTWFANCKQREQQTTDQRFHGNKTIHSNAKQAGGKTYQNIPLVPTMCVAG